MLGQAPLLKALKAAWQAASTSGAVAAAHDRYCSPVQGSMMGRVQPSLESTKSLPMKICREAGQQLIDQAPCRSTPPLHEECDTLHGYLALRGTLLASRLASAAELCDPAKALKIPKRVRVHDDRHVEVLLCVYAPPLVVTMICWTRVAEWITLCCANSTHIAYMIDMPRCECVSRPLQYG